MEIREWAGKTILTAEVIQAEFGRTYGHYLCLTFTEGAAHMIGVTGLTPHTPRPPIDEMRKAPIYFSGKDIAAAVERDETRRRKEAENARRRKRQTIERLQKELAE